MYAVSERNNSIIKLNNLKRTLILFEKSKSKNFNSINVITPSLTPIPAGDISDNIPML